MGLVKKKTNKPFLTSILDQDRKSVYRLEFILSFEIVLSKYKTT